MKTSKLFMFGSALLLLSLFVLPLWNITLEAPQYPEPLGLNIHINMLSDGNNPNDVKNIDLLNHYIGMQHLPVNMPEFKIFPIVILVMSLLGFIFGFVGKRALYLTWVVAMALLGLAGIYDFYQWLYEYGHNLDPNAILKFLDKSGNPMAYQPPVIGTKKLLNFTVHSYPSYGAYMMTLSMISAFVAFIKSGKEKE